MYDAIDMRPQWDFPASMLSERSAFNKNYYWAENPEQPKLLTFTRQTARLELDVMLEYVYEPAWKPGVTRDSFIADLKALKRKYR